ncbi:hypothetical protein [Adhaeribacter soli]|uniref:Uncharacterized protein n=1 Tax=Adhaeribacter soli TaxID=2607655 RepID=A0A5N1IYM3_9BACT|nr:hypothetical protein [Adhaeribacter soli]KAA9338997.1 hypothetical protein F0P94_09405 [Adhaeribacter soli]
MRYFSILLYIFCFSSATATAQQNTSANQVKIWYQALQWIYEDNNKTLPKDNQKPVPKVSQESVEQFEKNLAAASKARQDEYNFYTRMYQPVQEKLRKNQPVSDEMLIEAIMAEAAKKPDRKVENLRLELEKAASKNLATVPPDDQPENPEENLTTAANAATQEPENVPVPSAPASEVKTVKEEPNMLFNVISIAALLLATLAFYRSSRKSSRAMPPARTSEGYANAVGKPVQSNTGNQHVNALKKEIESLKKAYNNLKRENENWRAEMHNAIQDLKKKAYAAPQVAERYDLASNSPAPQNQAAAQPEYPAENNASQENFTLETDHLFAEETPVQNQVKYTRVPEDGQLKERDLHYDNRDTWSFIEVTLPENGSNTARFRINPHVNHALAINNSLDRLENAFEFARSANKATQLVNVADGELTKTAQGWQITKRAKIHLA